MTRKESDHKMHSDARDQCPGRWYYEWELYKTLAGTDTSAAARTQRQRWHAITPAPTVTKSDIRLLHPQIEPSAVRYVAVLAPHGDTAWLTVPFGQLSLPATPDEIHTDRTSPALRVLCGWNRFIIPTAALQQSWRVGTLTAEEMAWLASPPPERTGPPLRHPADPRWDYLEMESEFRERVRIASQTQTTYEIPYPHVLRRAAEDGPHYGDSEKGRSR